MKKSKSFNDSMHDLFTNNRPSFNGKFFDRYGGKQIVLNDTWGVNIELTNVSYNISKGKYTGNVKYTLYDHFGLDKNDVESYCGYHSGFAAWYILQHYDGFSGKYKPFRTVVRFEESF